MDLVDENFIIDLIENQELSYEQTSIVLKERFSGVRGLSSRSVRRFCSKRSISSRVKCDGSFQQGNIWILLMMYMEEFMKIFLLSF